MSNAQHTPAPWNYDDENGKLWITDDTCIGTIAQVITDPDKGNWDEDVANARLIAAAPELLSALQGLLAQFKTLAPMTEVNASCYLAEQFQAEAAIAKATK